MSTATAAVASSTPVVAGSSLAPASLTLPLFFSIPKPPEACTKPKTSTLRLPVARSSSPSPASIASRSDAGSSPVPVTTVSACAA